MRAQTSLPALGFALLLLTGVTVFGVAVADGALHSADRDALERQAAVSLSERLVAEDAPLTNHGNVLAAGAVRSLDGQDLRTRYGVANGTDAKVTLEGKTIASTGSVADGTALERLVLVEHVTGRTLTPQFRGQNSVTLPRRTRNLSLYIQPRSGVEVTTVEANSRVVLSNGSGLRGHFDVTVSTYRTLRLDFQATGALSAGSVNVTYYPHTTEKARLEVTVDA